MRAGKSLTFKSLCALATILTMSNVIRSDCRGFWGIYVSPRNLATSSNAVKADASATCASHVDYDSTSTVNIEREMLRSELPQSSFDKRLQPVTLSSSN